MHNSSTCFTCDKVIRCVTMKKLLDKSAMLKNSCSRSSWTTPDVPNATVEQLRTMASSWGAALAPFILPPGHHRKENNNGSKVLQWTPPLTVTANTATSIATTSQNYHLPLNHHWVNDIKLLPPSCLNHHKISSLQLTPCTMLQSNYQSCWNPWLPPVSCLLCCKPSSHCLLANLSPTSRHHLKIYLQCQIVAMPAALLQSLSLLIYSHIKSRIIEHSWLLLPCPSLHLCSRLRWPHTPSRQPWDFNQQLATSPNNSSPCWLAPSLSQVLWCQPLPFHQYQASYVSKLYKVSTKKY